MTEHTDRAATIYDVARVAGVSHQTVSRHIKGHRISDYSRGLVEKAIAELDYQPNSAARALATRRSTRIGALAYEMSHHGPVATLSAAAAAAREAGFVLDIVTMDPLDPLSARDAIELVNQHDLAGVIAFTPNDDLRAALDTTRFRVPVYIEDEGAEAIGPGNANFDAGVLTAEHLIGLGHRSFAHISGPTDWPAARLRSAGFAQTIEAAGHASPIVEAGDWGPASGFDAMTRILRSGAPVSAVFAANDPMAIGALAALHAAGRRVPHDVSLAGVDDQAEAAFQQPPLTTVPMHFAEQGRLVFAGLLARLNGDEPLRNEHAVPTRILVRSSTGPASISD